MSKLQENKSLFNIFGLSEASWKASRSSIRAVFGRLGGLLGPFYDHIRPFWEHLCRLWASCGVAEERVSRSRETPGPLKGPPAPGTK
eukprot:2539995-Pyramimonas_sp.AAC.1